ncbi:MAG: NAD(P)-dependent alcohol dehydrogenase [Robiginitomaculum sp.]|nr:NAD(P)-dependent alcohol dehydrogenase [Robiginitomaculum sp.]
MTETMRAMTITGDGARMVEIPRPLPVRGEVRVKVIASALNPAEVKVINRSFTGRFIHAQTSPLVLGWDFAGTVDALGDGVTDLGEGDAVWGHLAYFPFQKQGAFAEYITVPREALAAKPDDVPYHLAAAAATGAMTGLQSLRDLGKLGGGGTVLIIGAGGCVGSVAVGTAKRLGAHVTGVCSAKDIERVKALGADVVVDRKAFNWLDATVSYDVVFDTPAVYSYGRCAHVLRAGGAYVTTQPSLALLTGKARTLFSSKLCHFVLVASKRADLELVGSWLSSGLEVLIDSRYKISNLDGALKRQVDRDRTGRIVIDVARGWPP